MKCILSPVVCYKQIARNNYSLQKLRERASPNSPGNAQALPYFESRLFILEPNIRQGKQVFTGAQCILQGGM